MHTLPILISLRAVHSLLDATVAPGWKDFVAEKLTVVNAEHSKPLGGQRPMHSADNEDNFGTITDAAEAVCARIGSFYWYY